MHVVVGVPFRDGGCHHRAAAWRRVSSHLDGLPFPTVVADDGGEIFSRGASLNQVFTTTDADVVIGMDADTLVPLERLTEAADLAAEAPGLVQPFDEWVYVGRQETIRVLNSSLSPWKAKGQWRCPVSPTVPCLGTCNVLSRETWELAGGWLSGFRGWGCEDIAFHHQAATLAGPLRRLPGPAVHLYHPKTGKYAAEGTIAANSALMHQVAAASGDPAAMRAVIDSD